MISRTLVFSAVLGATALLRAEETPVPPTDPKPAAVEKAASPHFEGPEIMLLGWDTSNLVSSDFNGDQRRDLALLNNGLARIELLYRLAPGEKPKASARPVSHDRWEPVLDDAPFQKASIVTGQNMHALAAGDFNRDGRPDLAYTNDQGKLVLRFQGENEAWNEKQEIDVGENLSAEKTLAARDLDGDGVEELVLLTQKLLHILKIGKNGRPESHIRLPMAENQAFGLEISDIDGDGRLDILYLNGDDKFLIARRMLPDGSFGREESIDLGETPRSVVIPLGPDPKAAPGTPIARVQDSTGIVEVSRLVTTHEADGIGLDFPFSRFAVPAKGAKTQAFAMGSFIPKSASPRDLAVADGDGAQIWFFGARPDGAYSTPISIPTYSGVNDLAACELDGNPATTELIVLSRREKALGIMSRPSPEEAFRYPTSLPCEGTPLAATVMEKNGKVRILCLSEEERKRTLLVLTREGEGEFKITSRVSMPQIKSSPKALRMFDLNQDGLDDLLIFSPDEPLRVYLQEKSGEFAEFTDPQGLTGSLVDKLDASAVTFGDVDGDWKPEMVISRKGFVRAIRINSSAKVEVVTQFNSEDPSSEFAFSILIPPKDPSQKSPGLVAFDIAKSKLIRADRDENGVYREKTSEPSTFRQGTTPKVEGSEVLLISPLEIYLTRIGDLKLKMEPIASYESDLKGVKYDWIATGNFQEGPTEMVLLDSTSSRVLEIVQPPESGAADKQWKSLLFFPIFTKDPHYRGKTGGPFEPHDILVSDVTADGKQDIVLLSHDRLLVYPEK